MESSSSTKNISLEEQQFIHRKGFISLAIKENKHPYQLSGPMSNTHGSGLGKLTFC
jgi:hypothetical protein